MGGVEGGKEGGEEGRGREREGEREVARKKEGSDREGVTESERVSVCTVLHVVSIRCIQQPFILRHRRLF